MQKQGKAIKKIPGGKLVRVDVDYSTEKIEHVKITGDFFLHPDDLLEAMEERLAGVSLPLEGARLASDLQTLLDEQGGVLIGFTPVDLMEILEEALK
jgi:lipoate-protein ligase A